MVTVDETFKTKQEAHAYAKYVRRQYPNKNYVDREGTSVESVSVLPKDAIGYTVLIVFRFGRKPLKKKSIKNTKVIRKKKGFSLFGVEL